MFPRNVLPFAISGLEVFVFLFGRCHPRRGSLDGRNVFTNHQCANCQLAPDLFQRQKLESSFGKLMLSSRLTRIVAGAPPHLRGGRHKPPLSVRNCVNTPTNPFLLPSAGLNANSKYSQRCTARWKMVINTAEIIQN